MSVCVCVLVEVCMSITEKRMEFGHLISLHILVCFCFHYLLNIIETLVNDNYKSQCHSLKNPFASPDKLLLFLRLVDLCQ